MKKLRNRHSQKEYNIKGKKEKKGTVLCFDNERAKN